LAPDPDAERRDAAEIGLEAQNRDAVARRGAAARRLLPDAFLAARLERAGGSATAGLGGAAASDPEAVRLPAEVERFLVWVARRPGAVRAARIAEQLLQARRPQDAAEREPLDALGRQPEAELLAA
jgi:hypothetical protein